MQSDVASIAFKRGAAANTREVGINIATIGFDVQASLYIDIFHFDSILIGVDVNVATDSLDSHIGFVAFDVQIAVCAVDEHVGLVSVDIQIHISWDLNTQLNTGLVNSISVETENAVVIRVFDPDNRRGRMIR